MIVRCEGVIFLNYFNVHQIKKPVSKHSKDVKGTINSTRSWSNEEFGKVYEPVSAMELRRQHQVDIY